MKARGLGRVYVRVRGKRPKAGEPDLRRRTWWIEYWFRGKSHRESVASALKKAPHEVTPTDASNLLKKRLGEIGTGRFVAPASERLVFEDLARMVVDDYALKRRKSTPPLARLREFFADYRAVDIGPDVVRRYIARRRAQEAADATIRNEVAVLARGLGLAQESGRLLARPRLPLPRVRNARSGFFTDAEVATLLPHLPDYLRTFVEAAYITGWRRGELRSLTWSRVDWETGVLRLEPGTTKNEEGRVFPFAVHPRLAALLAEQRERTSEFERANGAVCPWVFHRGGHQVAWYYEAWHTACAKAGVPGRLVHDLRRSAVRNLVAAGVPERVAMKITGHKTRAVFDRYHIVSVTDVEDAVRRLASHHDESAPQSKVVSIRGAATRRPRRSK